MADTPQVYGFRINDANALVGVARRVGLEPRPAVGAVGGPEVFPKYLCYLAKTGATAITARVDETPGEGEVTLQVYDKATNAIIDYKYNGVAVTKDVLSFVASASGTNAYVWVGYDAFGTLWYLNEACEVA